MKIGGLQKFTLIDYPGKVACAIFLHGCNFRCGFCHNPELVVGKPEEVISEKDFLDFLEKRKDQLEGVCITGGEPLISLDKEFVRKIKNLGYLIKIDTNGSFPGKLRELIEEGLVDFAAMDIKGNKEQYDSITNIKVDIEKIEESVRLVSGLPSYEFRTTIVGGIHTPEEVEKMVKWLNDIIGGKPEKFCLQGFKNKGKLMESSYKMKKDVREDYLNELKERIKDYCGEVCIRV